MTIENSTIKMPERPRRNFVPEIFTLTDWEHLQPFFDDLFNRPLENQEDLRQWLRDRSELESMISEDLAWRYIRMTCYTDKQEYTDAYTFFVREIQPKMAPLSDQLNKKALATPFLDELEKLPGFDIMIREMRKDVEIYRDENVPLFTEIQTQTQRYGQISGAMTIDWEDKELTLQQAGVILQDTDREKRKKVYKLIASRRLKERETLDELYDRLIKLRTDVARNAGFENFRDYMFTSMGRFDYSPQDCFDFHHSISLEAVPLQQQLAVERKQLLGVEKLRPYDHAVDARGLDPLKPFQGSEQLTQKTINVFTKLDPFLGECLTVMREMGHLDLESRKGKAPGGYNYPLAEIGVPFIFMNATSTLRDMITILHEGGHAIHSFVTRELELGEFKHAPSEVAELASMSMELISMDYWDEFFTDEAALKRAKKEHLEQIIQTLPWVATIDKFQHWIYEHPQHGDSERIAEWNSIYREFSDTVTDWSGYELNRDYLWQKQLHLYEVPFYYIEYGMAQLGAIAVWKNYKRDPSKGLQSYLNALKLGYTRSIPEVYEAADIRFDFSRDYIRELMQFVKGELEAL